MTADVEHARHRTGMAVVMVDEVHPLDRCNDLGLRHSGACQYERLVSVVFGPTWAEVERLMHSKEE